MKIFKIGILSTFIICSVTILSAQAPPPPNNGNSPGGGNIPVGGGEHSAPIGSGVAILLGLGLGYGTKKVFDARKKLAE